MDEGTLNDLLECSVCLERLDTSSKVLPCQHTFCRKCLEVIVASHQELRCPECRILVDIKIDDLPPNILLMRILEGMKNASQNQANATKSMRPVNTSNITNIVAESNCCNNHEISKAKEQCQKRASNGKIASVRRIVPHAFALYDFTSKKTGDLNFKKGDIIVLKRKIDINWYCGEVNTREGAIPMNYVQVIVPLPLPQCTALYDFKMGPNEEEGCLTFKKGTIINVLRRVDHNWAEGCIGSCIGIFPIAFVEMNPLAKQLMESPCIPTYLSARVLPQTPADNITSDSSSLLTTSPNSSCSSNTTSNSMPSSPTSNLNSPQNDTAIKLREMKEKRHSLNALTTNTCLSMVQSNRHSAEILSITEPVEQMNRTLANNSNSDQNNTNITNGSQDTSSQPTSRASVLKTNIHQNLPSLPWAYIALYPYKPRKSDELELKKGCVYFVTERCLDGWYKGKDWADKSGVFPGNYVTPLRSRDQQQLIHIRKSVHNAVNTQQSVSPLAILHTTEESPNNITQQTFSPPELPPRCNTIASSSGWSKPLGLETFLNRTLISNSDCKSDNKSTNSTPKHGNSTCTNSNSAHPAAKTSPQHTTNKNKEKKDQTSSSSAVSLVKRLTNMKRSKSPTNTNASRSGYSMDNPVFEDTPANVSVSQGNHNTAISHHIHVRSGSCPSQLLQSLPIEMECSTKTAKNKTNIIFGSQRVKGHKERTLLPGIRQHNETNHKEKDAKTLAHISGKTKSVTPQHKSSENNPDRSSFEPSHRKSQSLDANTISSQVANVNLGNKSHGLHNRDSSSRYRCVVPYPPNNSNVELELNVDDIVYVHRKLKDGWYKGTHARTNKVGLFPASFVEPDN